MTAETRAFYDTVAATYAQMLPDTRAEAALDLGVIAQFAGLVPAGAHVLDAGCGTGRMITVLRNLGITDIAGVDLSPAMLAHAATAHPDVPLSTADLRALPVADGVFGGVLCWYAIIHSSRSEAVDIVRELARVLAPGGVVALGFQAGDGERVIERAYGHDVTLRGVLHRTADVAQTLRGAGCEIVAVADRAPIGTERSAQGFVIARRV